jgi:hypothetical protein
MKKVCLLALFLALTSIIQIWAQGTGLPEVTLYSPNKYGPSFERAFFNFETGSLAPSGRRWDLNYGSLYVSEDHDWFEVSTARASRSVIKDLGTLNWEDSSQVSAVEPFPKLKEGEARQITVNVDGADGRPGAPGGPKPLAGPVVNSDDNYGYSPYPPLPSPPTSPYVEIPWLARAKAAPPSPPPAPPRARQDGIPKVDPIFVKAVVGHIYVIHVVEGDADYYALFRVESLERGDHCTISWKLIPVPVN